MHGKQKQPRRQHRLRLPRPSRNLDEIRRPLRQRKPTLIIVGVVARRPQKESAELPRRLHGRHIAVSKGNPTTEPNRSAQPVLETASKPPADTITRTSLAVAEAHAKPFRHQSLTETALSDRPLPPRSYESLRTASTRRDRVGPVIFSEAETSRSGRVADRRCGRAQRVSADHHLGYALRRSIGRTRANRRR